YGTNAEDKYDDVVAAVARIRNDLPASIVALDIDKISPADVSILQLALVSEQADYSEVKKHAETLEQQLERVAGAKRVDIPAVPAVEVQIQIQQRKANALGIRLESIAGAEQSAGHKVADGHDQAGLRRFAERSSDD